MGGSKIPVEITERNIPSVMKSAPNWIVWKLEGKTDTFKGTKIPYSIKNPYKKASSTNPVTWGSFADSIALAKLHDMSGIGYVFTEEQGIVAIDIDGCIVNGIPTEIGKDILDLFLNKTYIETSQSGTGYHILTKGKLKITSFKAIEVYTSGRYFAITSNVVGGCTDINPAQDELDILCDRYTREITPQPIVWDHPTPTKKTTNFVDDLNLRVQDIGYPGNAKQSGVNEIRGSHPFHGSTTGLNYAINTSKNVWICRRDGHNSGGGPLELFAVREGIIKCEDARAGCLEGKWKEVIKALKRCGYDVPDKEKPHKVEPVQPVEAPVAETNYGKELVQSGKFLELLEKQFGKIWCGDQHINLWLIHAFANGFVSNSDEGLHFYVAGASGLGKSESVKHSLSLLPKTHIISGSFSRKGLLYLAEQMNPGSIVLMDDHVFDEDEAGIYRAMLAGWREASVYYTVDKGSKPIHYKERITQVTTSADGLASVSSEGQNESRFSCMEIQRTSEQMKRIFDFIRDDHEPLSKEEEELRNDAWKYITSKRWEIEIPFIKKIVVSDGSIYKIREFKKFLCVIRASALLHGRTITTEEDFDADSKTLDLFTSDARQRNRRINKERKRGF